MRDAGQRSGVDFGKAFATGFERQVPRMQSAMLKAADATRKVREETEKLNRAVASGDLDKMTAASNRLTAAHRGHDSALKNLASVQDAASQGGSRLAATLGEVAGAAGKAAGPAALAGLAVGLEGIVGIAASASGAVGVLPGVLAAAGAGFATAKIGLIGFSDAMDNLTDPEKFAESIGKLAPNAAQAANGIRDLVQGPLKELQQSTQQALFANVGPQLRQLAATLLPPVKTLTTTVAGALNQMFSGVATQLANPTTMAAINSTLDSIGAGFRNLAPAAAPFTAAIAELTKEGSAFLPEIAKGATDAATAFSQFITEASKSGQLKQWIGDGLDMVRQLGPLALDLAKSFLAFAPVGERIMPSIVSTMNGLAQILPPILKFVSDIGPLFWVWETAITAVSGAAKLLGDGFNAVSGIVDNVAAKVIPTLNRIGEAISEALAPLRAGAKLIGIDIPDYVPVTGARGGATVGRPGVPGPGTPGFGSSPFTGTGAPGAYGTLGSSAIVPPTPGPSWGPPKSVFATTPPTGGGTGVGGTQAPVTPFSGDPMQLLGGLPVTSSNYSAASAVLQSRHDVEQQRALVDQLEKGNVATQDQITKAKNDLAEKQQKQFEAELRLNEQRVGATDKFVSQMSSAADSLTKLDSDFGISKGLPGVVENITRALGLAVTAGFRGQLKAIEATDPDWQARLTQNGADATPLGGSYGGYGGGYPGDAALLANVPAGRYDSVVKDVSKGAADCASAVEDLVNIMDGKPTAGGSLWTGNASSVLPGMGFQRGMGGPGDFRVGYNSGHMQATLPGGTPFNWGSDAAAARGGIGGTGADDPSFTDHFFRPMAPVNITPSAPPTSPGGGIFSPANTNPALTSPTAPWGPGGISSPLGAGGQGYGVGQSPGMAGQAAGAPVAPVGGPAPGGWQPSATPNQGLGSMAGAAAAMAFPGAGEAAAKAGQLIDRGVKFGGQLAGIGVGGLMETFGLSDPNGGGNLQQSWLGRLASGLAQVKPATPTTAGQTKAPAEPQKHEGSGAQPGPSGPMVHIENFTQAENRNGQQVANDLAFRMYASKGNP